MGSSQYLTILTLSAHYTGLEGSVGVDDVHEGCGLLADDVLGQLGDGGNVGTVNKSRSSRVQSCVKFEMKLRSILH